MARIIFTDIERRICIINNNEKALFHKWVTRKNVIEPSPMIGGHPGGEIQFELGIVEFEDGTIAEVAPHQIKFIDGRVKELFQQLHTEQEDKQ